MSIRKADIVVIEVFKIYLWKLFIQAHKDKVILTMYPKSGCFERKKPSKAYDINSTVRQMLLVSLNLKPYKKKWHNFLYTLFYVVACPKQLICFVYGFPKRELEISTHHLLLFAT